VRLLLDTHVLLWWLADDRRLKSPERNAIADREALVYVSAATVWEIAIKRSLGSLPLPDRPERYVPESRAKHGIEALPLEEEAALQLVRLPNLHRDPFDRMLVCQGIVNGLVILTPDPLITQYPVPTSW